MPEGHRERARVVLDVQRHVNRLAREIAASRAHRTAETHNENYLVLTGQEEFTNPHTGEVELDTNNWEHRWVTPDGSVYLTDDEDRDPNVLRVANRDDFQRSPVRKRR
ncbi:MAG: hypothetical protein GY711_08125 [bacterium]|nr:hypothetical protein [bacterium]